MRWDALEDFRLRMATEPHKYAVLAHDALLDVGLRRHPWLPVKPWAEPMVWEASEASAPGQRVVVVKRFEGLQWMPLDSCGAIAALRAAMFYTEEDTLIPVPDRNTNICSLRSTPTQSSRTSTHESRARLTTLLTAISKPCKTAFVLGLRPWSPAWGRRPLWKTLGNVQAAAEDERAC